MAHTYNGPGWDQEGAWWPFLSFTWKLLLAGVVEVLVDGGRDPTWHPPRLQVRPVSPNLRTTCDQASVILIQNYVEDVCFLFSLPIFRTKKESDLQPTRCFLSWQILCTGSSSWLKIFGPFGVHGKQENIPVIRCAQMCMPI